MEKFNNESKARDFAMENSRKEVLFITLEDGVYYVDNKAPLVMNELFIAAFYKNRCL